MLTRLRTLVHHLNHAKMSTATGIHNTNVACCTIPPVRSDYKPKGIYKAYGGFEKVSELFICSAGTSLSLLLPSGSKAMEADTLHITFERKN